MSILKLNVPQYMTNSVASKVLGYPKLRVGIYSVMFVTVLKL